MGRLNKWLYDILSQFADIGDTTKSILHLPAGSVDN